MLQWEFFLVLSLNFTFTLITFLSFRSRRQLRRQTRRNRIKLGKEHKKIDLEFQKQKHNTKQLFFTLRREE